MQEKDHHQLLHDLMLENQRLLTENNQLLKKIRRAAVINFWLRVIGIAFFIGLPFVVYYYFVQPYFESMGSSFDVFIDGIKEIPGWKQYYESNTE